ncbi:MAG: PleD family two-component system response regulator [Rhizobiales bacterium]|nr:PleD family two-component system response regulator [Hyphomicrobiales bacterium]
MTARILVVDDIPANVKLLEARLSAEYFDVVTATNGPDALDICDGGRVDIVLLDVMMPEMDGFEVCRRIKANPKTHHVPVIMITALDQPADKVKGLEAGADDFLTKPVSDIAIMTRVKSLVRNKTLVDEMQSRVATGEELGFGENQELIFRQPVSNGRILYVDDRLNSYERISKILKRDHEVVIEPDPLQAVFNAAEGDYELIIISMNLRNFDGLRLCSQIRSLDRTRNLPILIIVDPNDDARLLRAIEMGVNDYVMRPIDSNELFARVRTQIRRKRYADRLVDSFKLNMEMAVTDALTGLHNRRYMESHLATLLETAKNSDKLLSLMIVDIDFFKVVNDTHGHGAGDEVLREFSKRLQKNIRGIDLACRYGGEEFVIIMPETDIGLAAIVAERIRCVVADKAFLVNGGSQALDLTISIGLSALQSDNDTQADIIKRADEALYTAKNDGRNRVVADAA